MPRRPARLVVFSGVALLAACATNRPRAPKHDARATIVTAQDLHGGGERSLLDIVARRLPNMQVLRTAECPDIYLRGRSTVETPSNPSIYVDGQHAANTCVLEMLSATDVAQVEVYPFGVASRPGYLADPNGLILIFMMHGARADSTP